MQLSEADWSERLSKTEAELAKLRERLEYEKLRLDLERSRSSKITFVLGVLLLIGILGGASLVGIVLDSVRQSKFAEELVDSSTKQVEEIRGELYEMRSEVRFLENELQKTIKTSSVFSPSELLSIVDSLNQRISELETRGE